VPSKVSVKSRKSNNHKLRTYMESLSKNISDKFLIENVSAFYIQNVKEEKYSYDTHNT
jgi:hypothetical protein